MVTDSDIACRAFADRVNLAKMNVVIRRTAYDVLRHDVLGGFEVAIETMGAKQIRRLPVTDRHKTMIGMPSLGDISHKVSEELSGEMLRAVSGHHV
jgi:hypothetical protein